MQTFIKEYTNIRSVSHIMLIKICNLSGEEHIFSDPSLWDSEEEWQIHMNAIEVHTALKQAEIERNGKHL